MATSTSNTRSQSQQKRPATRSTTKAAHPCRFLKITGLRRTYRNGPFLRELEEAPFIRLLGYWLEKSGFEVGHRVRVEVSPSRLVVTPLEESTSVNTAER